MKKQSESKEMKKKWHPKIIWSILSGILIIIALAGGGIAFIDFIDARIEKKINNEEFIKKVSKHIAPSLIFNQDGTVIYDRGALEIVSEIKVTHSLEDFDDIKLPKKIIVKCKTFKQSPPLLTSVENIDNFDIETKRVGLKDWEFTLVFSSCNGQYQRRFRLEFFE